MPLSHIRSHHVMRENRACATTPRTKKITVTRLPNLTSAPFTQNHKPRRTPASQRCRQTPNGSLQGHKQHSETKEQTLALTQTHNDMGSQFALQSPRHRSMRLACCAGKSRRQRQRFITCSVANPLMSPRNDVNRIGKVARGLGPLQHNIALDSAIVEKESLGPLKCLNFCADGPHWHKKSAPCLDALEFFDFRRLPQNQAVALTRAAKRDILRDAVFLCITPLVTPRISSG